MTSQPDKLFREKLENFSTPAPEAAWSRIEAGLNQSSNRSFLWVKIAASITLVGVATFLLWPTTTPQQPAIAFVNKLTEKATPLTKENGTEVKENKIYNTEPIKQKTTHAKNVIPHSSEVEEIKTEVQVAEAVPAQTEIIPTENSVTETIAQVNETVESQTILYSAEEVNAKFLKKEVVAEATTEEKKTSSIQKLIGVAYNIASADAGLGNIRQRKDEVLALNFRDKKQEQN
jgi:hypothetical protein